MTQAKWRDMTFEAGKELEGLAFSYEQIADSNNDAEGTPQTNERGTVLFPLSFSITLHAGTGIDVRAEIAKWEARVTKAGFLYLAGKRLGPSVQLRKVNVSDVKLDAYGRMRVAKLAFTFKEYDRATTSVVDNSAFAIGADPSEKADRKPENAQAATAEKVTISVGSSVKITGTTYYTGGKIPSWVLQRTHKVSQISGEKTLLGYPDGICSWVKTNELSLA